MRRFLKHAPGILAACMGALLLMRDLKPIRYIQMGITEMALVPGLLGLLTALRALARGHFGGIVLGGFGFGAAMWPLVWVLPTLINMEEAMQRGLGQSYQTEIPASMWSRMARYHWSIYNTLGRRNFQHKATVTHDVIYAQPGIRPLKLDIYQPQIPPVEGTHYPAIIALHPGGWRAGDKGGWFAPHHRYLASQGYVVFDIQYRLSQEAIWPAQLDDLNCVFQWLQQEASVYDVDLNRIALLGRSAGGHLALRAAYDGLPVKAVISLYGPVDLRLWGTGQDNAVTELMGGSAAELAAAYADASPVEFARDDLPPTLLIQGQIDEIVAPTHAEALASRLEATNTPIVVLRIPWGRHAFDAVMPGLGAQVIQYNIDRFLAWSMFRDE